MSCVGTSQKQANATIEEKDTGMVHRLRMESLQMAVRANVVSEAAADWSPWTRPNKDGP